MNELRDEALERGFDSLADGGGPRDGWQERVLARIADQPQPVRRTRWRFIAFAAGAAAAATAIALFVAVRERSGPPQDEAAAAKRLEQRIERIERELDAVSAAREQAFQRLLAAKTEEEKAAAEKSLEDAKRKLDSLKARTRSLNRVWPERDDGPISVTCDPSDPLCGVE